VIHVLLFHHLDRHRGVAPASCQQHREENLLLLLHVRLELLADALELRGETAWTIGAVGVHGLDLARHLDESRQLRAVRLVERVEYVPNQVRERAFVPTVEVGRERRLGFDLAENFVDAESLLRASVGEAHAAAATEVEIVSVEDPRRSGAGGGELGQGRLGEDGRQGLGHEGLAGFVASPGSSVPGGPLRRRASAGLVTRCASRANRCCTRTYGGQYSFSQRPVAMDVTTSLP
jgi:hypothetical protein